MIYLNNAATSWPKPEEVYRAVDACTRHYAATFGRGSDSRSVHASEIVFECRRAVADLFGIRRPERLVFTFNATDSINTALKGVMKQGGHLILSDMEHNAVLRPALAMQAAGRIDLSIAQSDPRGVLDASAVRRLLRPNTTLVETVHVSNVTGAVNDVAALAEVCTHAGVPLMVDASQSAGSMDIEVARDGIDILVAPGHKGLLGPPGTGILYLGPKVEAEPLREGGTGSDSLRAEQPVHLPDRFESGTMNLPGLAGLLEGVRFVKRKGVEEIGRHKRSLVRALRRALGTLEGFRVYGPDTDDATILAFGIAGADSVELSEWLAERQVCVRGGFHCAASVHKKHATTETGMVRVSPGPFSTMDDIAACTEEVCKYVKDAPATRRK